MDEFIKFQFTVPFKDYTFLHLLVNKDYGSMISLNGLKYAEHDSKVRIALSHMTYLTYLHHLVRNGSLYFNVLLRGCHIGSSAPALEICCVVLPNRSCSSSLCDGRQLFEVLLPITIFVYRVQGQCTTSRSEVFLLRPCEVVVGSAALQHTLYPVSLWPDPSTVC